MIPDILARRAAHTQTIGKVRAAPREKEEKTLFLKFDFGSHAPAHGGVPVRQ
jgi:hypothetical protein